MKIGDIVVRKSYDKDIIFRIIDIKEVRGKVYCILKGLSIRIIADSPKDDLEVVDYVYVEEKEKILNNRVNEAMKKAKEVIKEVSEEFAEWTGRKYEFFEKYKLDDEILNESRKRYLYYHRQLFEKKKEQIK